MRSLAALPTGRKRFEMLYICTVEGDRPRRIEASSPLEAVEEAVEQTIYFSLPPLKGGREFSVKVVTEDGWESHWRKFRDSQ